MAARIERESSRGPASHFAFRIDEVAMRESDGATEVADAAPPKIAKHCGSRGPQYL
jgi:hypothetical protein